DAVGGEEPTHADTDALFRLVSHPILVGVDPGPVEPRLSADLAVHGPCIHAIRGDHVRGHEEVAGDTPPVEADVQAGGAHVDAGADGSEPVLRQVPSSRGHAAVRGRRLALPRGRQLLARERPPVRGEQTAPGWREVARRAARVLAGEEDRFGADAGGAGRQPDPREQEDACPPHRDPAAGAAAGVATSDAFTWTSLLTPMPR